MQSNDEVSLVTPATEDEVNNARGEPHELELKRGWEQRVLARG